MNEQTSGKKESQRVDDDGSPFWTDRKRLLLLDNFVFTDFYHKLVVRMAQGGSMQRYHRLCRGAYGKAYSGADPCKFNVAYSFVLAKQWLMKEVSPRAEDWLYRNVHVNMYPSQPWSMTPLKALFHREVPTGGNSQTPGVSKYRMSNIEDHKGLKSIHTANYRQVVSFGETHSEDVNLMSLDTGMSGNLFGGHYFTMNSDHLSGKLYRITTNFNELEADDAHYNLQVLPLSQKKKRVVRPLEEAFVDGKTEAQLQGRKPNGTTDEDWGGGGPVDRGDPDGISEFYMKKDAGEL